MNNVLGLQVGGRPVGKFILFIHTRALYYIRYGQSFQSGEVIYHPHANRVRRITVTRNTIQVQHLDGPTWFWQSKILHTVVTVGLLPLYFNLYEFLHFALILLLLLIRFLEWLLIIKFKFEFKFVEVQKINLNHIILAYN